MRLLSFVFFVVGLIATGALGTETRLLFSGRAAYCSALRA
jgi:hypothetical protein